MNLKKITVTGTYFLVIVFSSALLPSATHAIDFPNGIDLSFFDNKKPAQSKTATVPGPREDFRRALKAYNNGNYIKAFKLFKVLAHIGDSNAQYSLGSMYYNGFGVLKNRQQAVLWYRHSAKSGHIVAQHNLGALYYKGEGVIRNYSYAYKWFQKAALQGHADSQYNLAIMYFAAKGVAQNKELAFKWFKLAAVQGDINAQHNLATMYFKGIGVEKNLAQAFRWHTRAARNGHSLSHHWLRAQLKISASKSTD